MKEMEKEREGKEGSLKSEVDRLVQKCHELTQKLKILEEEKRQHETVSQCSVLTLCIFDHYISYIMKCFLIIREWQKC